MAELPEWWDWELFFAKHAELRMGQRSFSEIDVRIMLEHAERIRPSRMPGRWVVSCKLAGVP